MADLAGLFEHGIFTSKAHYWVHLHPLFRRIDENGRSYAEQPMLYWYSVAVCRQFIKRQKLPVTFGYSKDDQEHTRPTGAGYLIRKNISFIHSCEVPRDFVDGYAWHVFADRELGQAGQDVVEALYDIGRLKFPWHRAEFLSSEEDQRNARDMRVVYFKECTFEIKTEVPRGKLDTPNLFVQSHERDHNPHIGFAENGEHETRNTPWDKR